MGQTKNMGQLAKLFNTNVRSNFLKDKYPPTDKLIYEGSMVEHVKTACASNLIFYPDKTNYQAIAGLGGTFAITTGLCYIGEDNKECPVAFTHLYWVNGTGKICIDIFRLNVG